ncbi:MAG: penicillin-binding protein activator [Rhodobacteraceae bacterium]|nr:penicillin-binding protein activator [Paracoccaceae bacterium]
MAHAVNTGLRRFLKAAAGFAFAGVLAACGTGSLIGGGSGTGNGPVQVALIVPTGASDPNVAQLAQNLTNAARLAVADLQGVAIDLRVYDDAGDPGRAAQLAVSAVNDGADVIVGPLFAESANAAGVAVAKSGVAVLSFSNNPTIAGGNVFVMGPTFDNTARRLVGYAKSRGIDSIMVVAGNSAAESLGRDAILAAAGQAGMRVAGTQGFEMSQQGVVQAVPGIVAAAKGTGAQALFLTSNTDSALPILSQLLPENGLPPSEIQYIGLTRWDVPASALSLPGLQGGWFALPDTAAQSAFNSRYAAAYGVAPHSIAGLGYDGIAAIGALVKGGQSLSPKSFTQARGFAGASGAFRFLPNGNNERALSIATIENRAVKILEPAPTSFGVAGF